MFNFQALLFVTNFKFYIILRENHVNRGLAFIVYYHLLNMYDVKAMGIFYNELKERDGCRRNEERVHCETLSH